MTILRDQLRSDLLFAFTPQGSVLVDLVRDLTFELDSEETQALQHTPDTHFEAELLRMRFESEALLEGPGAEHQRQAACFAKTRQHRPLAPPIQALALSDFEAATILPDFISPAWRSPERWRRLAEQAQSGERYLKLEQLLSLDAAEDLLEHVQTLPFERLETQLLSASRARIQQTLLEPWTSLLCSTPFRHLVGVVLNRPISPGLVMNAWRLQEGDFMGVHPDGPRYQATLSLGLCPDWSAAYGGAIAFGIPQAHTFEVNSRWFPHLGDACLFAPDASTWHAVEAVRGSKLRHSLTNWWVDEAFSDLNH